jgi:membrane protease YdiL (CAAX protease family)
MFSQPISMRAPLLTTLSLHVSDNCFRARSLPLFLSVINNTLDSIEVDSGAGIGISSLVSNLAVQGMYIGVAALGISVLLAPFGGPSVPNLLIRQEAPYGVLGAEALLGLGVAVLVLYRGGLYESHGTEALAYGAAEAEQMRPLWQISGGESRTVPAICAIILWQLAIALAEELYYRGLIQSGARMLVSSLVSAGSLAESLPAHAVGDAVGELLALVAASSLFGLVHTEFDGMAGDEKGRWFRTTAGYGLLYGLLYTMSGRLAAPVFAHAGYNIGLCVRDWRRMRRTPVDELKQIFDAEKRVG